MTPISLDPTVPSPAAAASPPVGSAGGEGDEALVLRWRDHGDREALGALYHRHLAGAWRCARRLTGSDADAEDAVHAAFLDAIREARRYRPGTDPRAWLMTLVANRARMQYRERLRRRRREHAVATVLPPATPPTAPVPEGEVLLGALDHLAPRVREAVWLRHGEGMATRAIAQRVGRSERTVREDIAEGLALLRQYLARAGVASVAIEPGLAATIAHVPASLARRTDALVATATLPVAGIAGIPLAVSVAVLVVLGGGWAATHLPAPHAAPALPAAASPPLTGLDAVLARRLTLPLRHTTLGVLLDAINQALPPDVELPYACEPAVLADAWAGITPPAQATVRELLDQGAAAYGCSWRVMAGIIVFIAPPDPAGTPPPAGTPAPSDTTIDTDVQAFQDQRIARLRPQLLAFATSTRDQAADLALTLDPVLPQDVLLSPPKGQRSLLAAFREDAEVQAALRHALSLGRVSWLGRVLAAIPPPGATDLLLARLHDALPATEVLAGDTLWTKDDGGAPGLPEAIAAGADAATVTHLLALLSPDERGCALAARALGLAGARAAIPHLVPLLDDDDRAIAGEAAEALGRLGAHVAEERILALAQRTDRPLGAVRALGLLHVARAAPLLWSMLRVEHTVAASQQREAATAALTQCPAPAVLAALPAADTVNLDILSACRVVAATQSASTVPWLRSLGEHTTMPYERTAVANALARLATPADLQALGQVLLDPRTEPTQACIAASALGRRATPEALAVVQRALQTPALPVEVRAAVVQALSLSRLPAAIQAVPAVSRDPAPAPPLIAAVGAGRTPEERAALERLSATGSPAVRMAALTALTDVRDERPDADAGGREVLQSRSARCAASAYRLLLAALQDQDPIVRQGALALIPRLDRATGERFLREALRAASSEVRLLALHLYASPTFLSHEPATLTQLLALARQDPVPAIRQAAARTVTFDGVMLPAVPAALREDLKTERDPAVRTTLQAVLAAITSGRFSFPSGNDGDPLPDPPDAASTPEIDHLRTF